jgi:uncharacterized membrane-anchored protein
MSNKPPDQEPHWYAVLVAVLCVISLWVLYMIAQTTLEMEAAVRQPLPLTIEQSKETCPCGQK